MSITKVLFDVTALVNGQNKNFSRSGIYWVADNIIKTYLEGMYGYFH